MLEKSKNTPNIFLIICFATLSLSFSNQSHAMGILKIIFKCCIPDESARVDFYRELITGNNLIPAILSANQTLRNHIPFGDSTLLHCVCESHINMNYNINELFKKREDALDIANLFFKNDAQEYINVFDKNGRTPLFLACEQAADWKIKESEFTEIIELLILNGADITMDKNFKGETARKSPRTLKIFDITKRFYNSIEANSCFWLTDEEAKDHGLLKFSNELKTKLSEILTKKSLLKKIYRKKLIDCRVNCESE